MPVKPIMALGVGVLLLTAGLTPMMSVVSQDNVQFIELDNGSSQNVTETLSADAVDVNETNATVQLENSRTLDSEQNTLNISENATVSLSGENVLVNLTAIPANNSTAQYRLQYPPMFGFNDLAAVFFRQLDTLLAIVGFILVSFSLVEITGRI